MMKREEEDLEHIQESIDLITRTIASREEELNALPLVSYKALQDHLTVKNVHSPREKDILEYLDLLGEVKESGFPVITATEEELYAARCAAVADMVAAAAEAAASATSAAPAEENGAGEAKEGEDAGPETTEKAGEEKSGEEKSDEAKADDTAGVETAAGAVAAESTE